MYIYICIYLSGHIYVRMYIATLHMKVCIYVYIRIYGGIYVYMVVYV